jgi:uncharacterized RDD family membrane protein YckC
MVTPEAVALEFRTAHLGSRILAFFLDYLIIVAVALVFFILTGVFVSTARLVVPQWLVIAFVFVLLPAWLLGYFIAFETLWHGRTPGKAALGLRVVTSEGGPVRFRHAFIRGLLGLVDFWMASGMFAVLFILFRQDNRRLGDIVAGTLVLRERSGLSAPTAVSFPPPPGLEAYTATLDVSRLSNQEYQAVRSYLLRAQSLPPAPRYNLAVQLATPLAGRLRPAPPPGIPAEQFLQAVAAAYQQRQRAAHAGIPVTQPPAYATPVPYTAPPSPAGLEPPPDPPAPDQGFAPPA